MKTASWVSTSINQRVREIVEWSAGHPGAPSRETRAAQTNPRHASFACRRRLPIAIDDGVVREIDDVDPEDRITA